MTCPSMINIKSRACCVRDRRDGLFSREDGSGDLAGDVEKGTMQGRKGSGRVGQGLKLRGGVDEESTSPYV